MCARRFLMIVFVLTLLVVAAGLAIYQWGGNLLLRQAVPKGHFRASAAGGGPDYSQPADWVARPGFGNDPSRWLPAGFTSGRSGNAAIFYIHPTTYLDRDRWNAPIDTTGPTEFRTELFVQTQASAFTGAGQVWAPRYRQAAFGAFLLKSEDAQRALDLAYGDIARAFDRFAIESGDQPIILAAHSQGALHLERLLRDRIAGKPIARRLVAAYLAGWPISMTSDLPSLGLPACRVAQQTGCILSWMSFGDPANPDLIFDEWEKTAGFTGGPRRPREVLCVNPITGTEGGAAPAQDNPGTLIPTPDLTSASLLPGAVGAHCDKGLLIVDGKMPAIGPYALPGNNYHVYDYSLFWGAIREDSERRLAAWRR
jgi:hypothetical protein